MNITVNADDYGINRTRTDAIIRCFDLGLIDTATLMGNASEENFAYAVEQLIKNGYENRIGIHLCITSGKPLTEEMSRSRFFCDANGKFRKKKIILISKHNRKLLHNELEAQIERLEKTGIRIHHADSHHFAHTWPGVISTYMRIVRKHNIEKIRIAENIGERFIYIYSFLFNRFVLPEEIRYSDYFGSVFDIDHIKNCKGSIELMCHPDFDADGRLTDKTAINGNGLEENLILVRKMIEKTYI